MSTAPNPQRLFLASCIALITTAMTFAIRARLEGVFGENGVGLTGEQIGAAFAPAFFGFTIAMIIGGPLVDALGMKRILNLAFVGHLLGIIVTLLAKDFWTLFAGTLLIGIGNGMVEAACNPLVATLFTKEKTKMLNRFHVWFPGGIVIGSVVAYLLVDIMGLSWQIMVCSLFIPLFTYGFLFWGQSFPVTERVEMGVSSSGMWKALATPLFIFIAICMLLTAATELGTNQRISALLETTQVAPLLVLAFINIIMASGRAFAGPVAHRLSTSGMLLFSAVFSLIGLVLLSYASGMGTFAAAAVFAIGITFFWPTMLSFVSENIPESGALGLSVMGGLGMFSTSIVLPLIGKVMDENTTGGETLRIIAFLPAILVIAFAGLYFYMRNRRLAQAS